MNKNILQRKLFLPIMIILGSVFASCSSEEIEEYVFPTEGESIKISKFVVGDICDVIFTYRNFLIEDKSKDGKRYICVSKDLGKSWHDFENTYGDIVYVHIFSTGDILFATKDWCYCIDKELSEITPSQVYDYNGSVFKPVAIEHFFQIGDVKNYIWKIDRIELIAWGDYSYAYDYDPNYVARVWYTTDYGRTVRCAIRFDQTKIDGKVQNCRHTHGVRYDRFDNTFYIPTGDARSEIQLIKGKYNSADDKWDFHRIGSHMYYKFARIYFDQNNVYLVTDYGGRNKPTGLVKCNKNSLHDRSCFDYIYDNPDKQAFSTCEFDMNGNKVLTPDLTGQGFIYYARDNYDFKKIPVTGNGLISGFTSPNYNGDVYARFSLNPSFPFRLTNYFNFTQSMRNSGVFDYMLFSEQIPTFFDEDFFFTYQNE